MRLWCCLPTQEKVITVRWDERMRWGMIHGATRPTPRRHIRCFLYKQRSLYIRMPRRETGRRDKARISRNERKKHGGPLNCAIVLRFATQMRYNGAKLTKAPKQRLISFGLPSPVECVCMEMQIMDVVCIKKEEWAVGRSGVDTTKL